MNTKDGLKVELLLLCIEGDQLRWLGHLASGYDPGFEVLQVYVKKPTL